MTKLKLPHCVSQEWGPGNRVVPQALDFICGSATHIRIDAENFMPLLDGAGESLETLSEHGCLL